MLLKTGSEKVGEIYMIKVAPSILSADFARLGEEIDTVKSADYLHFDVMDGVFVPNISVGIPVLESVRKCTGMYIDVHLMITRPLRYVDEFARAGADLIVFHEEADSEENVRKTLDAIKSAGKKTGMAVKPGTPAENIRKYIEDLDLVLVMTVEPGFGGQPFMEEQLGKITAVRTMIDEINPACELEVDGGIGRETGKMAVSAGANVLVAGSSIFKAKDREKEINALRAL